MLNHDLTSAAHDDTQDREPDTNSGLESSGVLTRHDVTQMRYAYANVIMLQTTPVDVGIGFGLTEFDDSGTPLARYHTMMRLSFEQAKHLVASLHSTLSTQSEPLE